MDTTGMTIFEFGRQKLAAKDIDPLYNALYAAKWPSEKTARFILAFVAFDLAGLAAAVVDAGKDKFWEAMRTAGTQTKRGSPRRYYRGAACMASIYALEGRYFTAAKALGDLYGHYTTGALATVAGTWPGWGPTAAWKIADMAERCLGVDVDFTEFGWRDLLSNDMVQKGLDKACAISGLDTEPMQAKLLKYDWRSSAPGRPSKPIGPQELETILCYYSHDWVRNKHMPGMDIRNICAELNDPAFGPTKSAKQLLNHWRA